MRIKQVIVIRKDLKMRRGKEIAQGSHASMAFLIDRIRNNVTMSHVEQEWAFHGMAKVCLQAESEEELVKIYENAKAAGLVVHIIRDSGRTEFNGVPTLTALAIGPDDEEKIDQITGSLRLY